MDSSKFWGLSQQKASTHVGSGLGSGGLSDGRKYKILNGNILEYVIQIFEHFYGVKICAFRGTIAKI